MHHTGDHVKCCGERVAHTTHNAHDLGGALITDQFTENTPGLRSSPREHIEDLANRAEHMRDDVHGPVERIHKDAGEDRPRSLECRARSVDSGQHLSQHDHGYRQ